MGREVEDLLAGRKDYTAKRVREEIRKPRAAGEDKYVRLDWSVVELQRLYFRSGRDRYHLSFDVACTAADGSFRHCTNRFPGKQRSAVRLKQCNGTGRHIHQSTQRSDLEDVQKLMPDLMTAEGFPRLVN